MKTICYVDGYNLYYGCLKNTPHKWLDLERLLIRLLKEQNPKSELVMVKYFTADIKAKFSRHGQLAHDSQQRYLRVLKERMGNEKLSGLADWSRRHIRAEELKGCQLPAMIPTQRKAIRKPDHW